MTRKRTCRESGQRSARSSCLTMCFTRRSARRSMKMPHKGVSRGHDVEGRSWSDAGGVLGQTREYARVSAGTRFPILTPPTPRSLSFPASEHARTPTLARTSRRLDKPQPPYTPSLMTKAIPFPCTPTGHDDEIPSADTAGNPPLRTAPSRSSSCRNDEV